MRAEVEQLLAFAQDADSITDTGRLTRHLRAALRPLGVTSLSVNLISTPFGGFNPRILFGERWSHWSDHYVRHALHEDDPAIRMLLSQTRPFTWREALACYRSPAAERVLDACHDLTGSWDGFVVPVRDTDGVLLSATFSGGELHLDPETRQGLHLAGYYYATRGRELQLGVRLDPACPLSPRQIDCLRWVHAGKTDWEIAALLGLSARTVHNHVEAAKRTLNVSKRGRAAFEAWRKGWLE